MPYDDDADFCEPHVLHVMLPGISVRFFRADAPTETPLWTHSMQMVPRVGDILHFRCTHSLEANTGHPNASETYLLMALPWVVERVVITLTCTDQDTDETDEAPEPVSQTMYDCYVVMQGA